MTELLVELKGLWTPISSWSKTPRIIPVANKRWPGLWIGAVEKITLQNLILGINGPDRQDRRKDTWIHETATALDFCNVPADSLYYQNLLILQACCWKESWKTPALQRQNRKDQGFAYTEYHFLATSSTGEHALLIVRTTFRLDTEYLFEDLQQHLSESGYTLSDARQLNDKYTKVVAHYAAAQLAYCWIHRPDFAYSQTFSNSPYFHILAEAYRADAAALQTADSSETKPQSFLGGLLKRITSVFST